VHDVVDGHPVVPDGDDRLAEVHVDPAEAGELAAAHAGVEVQVVDGRPAVLGGRLEERRRLLCRPGLHLGRVGGLLLRSVVPVDQRDRVDPDEAGPGGVAERAAQDGVDLVDRRRRERHRLRAVVHGAAARVAAALAEDPVQLGDRLGGQVAQPDLASDGDDLVGDVPLVVGPGAALEVGAAVEPLLQVVAEQLLRRLGDLAGRAAVIDEGDGQRLLACPLGGEPALGDLAAAAASLGNAERVRPGPLLLGLALGPRRLRRPEERGALHDDLLVLGRAGCPARRPVSARERSAITAAGRCRPRSPCASTGAPDRASAPSRARRARCRTCR